MDGTRKILIVLVAILFVGSTCGCIDKGVEKMDDFIGDKGEEISSGEIEDADEYTGKELDKIIEELSGKSQIEIMSKLAEIIEETSELNVIRYDDGEANGYSSSDSKGFAVFFPNDKKLNIYGIKTCGARYDGAMRKFDVEIWDKNLKTLYSVSCDYVDFFPENYIPIKNNDLKWVAIGVPNVEVDGDFYVVVFTYGGPFSWYKGAYDSPTYKGGIVTGRDSDTNAGNSFVVNKNPNIIADWEAITTWDIRQEDTDWMIRAICES